MTCSRIFLDRHEGLMASQDATLPCCFQAPDGLLCQDSALFGVVRYGIRGRWEVVPCAQLPLQRNGYQKRGERRHPEFCRTHANVVCAQRQGGPKP